MNTTLEMRREIRNIAGAPSHLPVKVIDGDVEPRRVGTPGHWVSEGGKKVVNYPLAYQRAGGRCTYVKSTAAVEVGKEFIKNNNKLLGMIVKNTLKEI